MGHPKLKKKTYSKPTHPWQKERLEEEKELLREFGLKNKEEIWKVSSLLRKYAKQAKNLIALNTPQSEIQKAQLLKKISSLNLIDETAKLEDVLTITLNDILSRRLQSLVYKNKLAKSIRQARQLITHEHVIIGDKKITSPSYLVSKQEEALISFASNSPLSNQDHPERVSEKEQMPTKDKKKPKSQSKTEKGESQKSKISEGLETKSQSKKTKEEKKKAKKKTEKKKEKEEPKSQSGDPKEAKK